MRAMYDEGKVNNSKEHDLDACKFSVFLEKYNISGSN